MRYDPTHFYATRKIFSCTKYGDNFSYTSYTILHNSCSARDLPTHGFLHNVGAPWHFPTIFYRWCPTHIFMLHNFRSTHDLLHTLLPRSIFLHIFSTVSLTLYFMMGCRHYIYIYIDIFCTLRGGFKTWRIRQSVGNPFIIHGLKNRTRKSVPRVA